MKKVHDSLSETSIPPHKNDRSRFHIKGREQLMQYADLLANQPGFSGTGAEVKGHG